MCHLPAQNQQKKHKPKVTQTQSQKYNHQSDIIDITLLPSLLTLYLFHTLL